MPLSPRQRAYLDRLDALPMGHEERMAFFRFVLEWQRQFRRAIFGFGIHEFDVHRALSWALDRIGVR